MKERATAMSRQDIARAYCALMQEARMRIDLMNHISRGEANIHPMFAREICYLQFRFLCEMIAVGCLVACGDVPTAQALKKTYHPHAIIAKLERLNPDFYPQPARHTTTAQG